MFIAWIRLSNIFMDKNQELPLEDISKTPNDLTSNTFQLHLVQII